MRVVPFFRLRSMLRDAHASSLILDCDIAIQALVSVRVQVPKTIKLTRTCHNLIRYWIEA